MQTILRPRLGLVSVVLLVACESAPLDLPPQVPAPSVGTLAGRVVVSVPGTPLPVAAVGASVSLGRTSLRATTDGDGRFSLEPLLERGGQLHLRFDRDGDGRAELSRTLDLSSTGAGPGREVSLGDVLLGRNASVRGRVLRAGHEGERSGHSGTTVLVAETPFLTLTGDDGTFLLSDLPAGPLTITAWREGFEVAAVDGLQLQPGEALALDDLVLRASTASGATGTLQFTLAAEPDADVSAGNVRALGTTTTTISVPPSGEVSTTLAPGVWTLAADLAGYGTGLISNVLVRPGETTDAGKLVLFAGGTVIPVDQSEPQPGPVDPLLEAPVARISVPAVVARAGVLVLDGTASKAALAPPGSFLRYAWTVRAGELALDVTPNASSLAGRTQVVVPDSLETLDVGLAVVDVRTNLTATATASVEVLPPPVARVAPSSQRVLPGAQVTFDAGSSTSSTGGTLTFRWLSASLGVNDVDTPTVTVVAPTTPGLSTLQLVVSDGVLTSAPAEGRLEVVDAATPPLVRAGADRVVDAGTTVRLSAEVESALDSTISWTQVAGAPVTLADAGTLTPGFTAPDTFDQLVFRVTATTTAGTSSDEVVVEVRDLSPPRVVATEPADGLSASPFFVAFTFSEPIDPATLEAALDESGNQQGLPAPRVTWDAARRRVVVVPAQPFKPGLPYTVGLSGLRDRAPVANSAPDVAFRFVARAPRWRSWTAHESDVPWLPAVLPGASPLRFGTLAKPSGCGGGGFHGEFHDTTDDGRSTRVSAVDQCLGYDGSRTVRALRTADGLVWLHFSGSNLRFNGTAFDTLQGIGSIDSFTDGVVPHLLYGDDNGCEVYRWRPEANSFGSLGRFGCYRGSGHGAASGGRILSAVVHTGVNPNEVRVFERTATAGFAQLGSGLFTPAVGEVAVGYAQGTTPIVAAHHVVSGTNVLSVGRWSGSAWVFRERVNPSGPASGEVELAVRDRFGFVAYTAASVLRAFTWDPLDDASAITPVDGPDGGFLGTAANCTAFKPVVAMDDEGVNLSWSESCPSGWKSVIRRWE